MNNTSSQKSDACAALRMTTNPNWYRKRTESRRDLGPSKCGNTATSAPKIGRKAYGVNYRSWNSLDHIAGVGFVALMHYYDAITQRDAAVYSLLLRRGLRWGLGCL